MSEGVQHSGRSIGFSWAVISIGLAIFSMFFGAGNLMYPIQVGMKSGSNTALGMVAFLVSTVGFGFMGFVAMILFNGDYDAFFGRLGKVPGKIVVGTCMFLIGPLVGIPRIVTLSHTMIAPFIPIQCLQDTSSLYAAAIFALLFLGATFLATYRESKIVELLGNVISPLLLASLAIIVIKGIFGMHSMVESDLTAVQAATKSLMIGYETLDLLAAIFFSAEAIRLIKNMCVTRGHAVSGALQMGVRAGLIGLFLLAIVYVGLGFVGLFYGHGLAAVNAGELFREAALRIVGSNGALIIGTAVLMACLSTSIALAAVTGEYLHETVFRKTIHYVPALGIALLACLPLSIAGLDQVLTLTGGPITFIGYPVVIALTVCNVAYKLVGFKPVKIPVLVTFIGALVAYIVF